MLQGNSVEQVTPIFEELEQLEQPEQLSAHF